MNYIRGWGTLVTLNCFKHPEVTSGRCGDRRKIIVIKIEANGMEWESDGNDEPDWKRRGEG